MVKAGRWGVIGLAQFAFRGGHVRRGTEMVRKVAELVASDRNFSLEIELAMIAAGAADVGQIRLELKEGREDGLVVARAVMDMARETRERFRCRVLVSALQPGQPGGVGPRDLSLWLGLLGGINARIREGCQAMEGVQFVDWARNWTTVDGTALNKEIFPTHIADKTLPAFGRCSMKAFGPLRAILEQELAMIEDQHAAVKLALLLH